jgi:hypothetical protein
LRTRFHLVPRLTLHSILGRSATLGRYRIEARPKVSERSFLGEQLRGQSSSHEPTAKQTAGARDVKPSDPFRLDADTAVAHPGGSSTASGLWNDAAAGALFVNDRELHRRVCPSLGWDSFRAVLKGWERDGFPKTNSSMRARFYPAVEAWLNLHYGLREGACADAEDGPENFGSSEHATTREGARPQARPHPQGRHGVPVLDGASGRPQSDGLPRLVHPPAARR